MSTSSHRSPGLARSASMVSLGTACSRVTGLIREQVIAYFFGASMATDAFVAAFRIPNLLRDMFAEGALGSAFVPVFKERLVKAGEGEAQRLAQTTFTALLAGVGTLVALGILAAPAIVFVVANGFTAMPEKFALTVDLTRIMFPFLLLVSLAALAMGILNAFGRFTLPAFAPVMFNVGSVIAVVLFFDLFNQPIYALAWGVLIGGAGQLLIQIPTLWRLGGRVRLRFDWLSPAFRAVLRLFGPVVLGLSAGRVNILVSTLVASFLVEGALAYLSFSYRLMHFPLGVFAVAIGTVALPKASELFALGRRDELSGLYRRAVDMAMFVIIPSAAALAFLAEPAVALLYGWGEFDQTAIANTGFALRHYSYGLIGFAAVRVTAPIFYAAGDARTPMYASIAAVVINIALYYPLIQVLGFAGLAAATSLSSIANFALLIFALARAEIVGSIWRLGLGWFRLIIVASLVFWAALFVPVPTLETAPLWVQRLLDLIIPATVGGLAYLVICAILQVREVTALVERIRRRFQASS